MADAFEASIAKAVDGKDRLSEALKDFRSEIKNDLASISASGDKVRDEARKITAALDTCLRLMGSPEMGAAIANAERLAAAMQAIHNLQETRVSFALISPEQQK